MASVKQQAVCDQVLQAYQLYDDGRIDDAKTLTLKIENECASLSNDPERAICRKYVAACLVDIGGAVSDESMVKRGTQYFREWIEQNPSGDEVAHDYYNLGNGYFGLWSFHSTEAIRGGLDAEEHRLTRHFYRQAIEHLRPRHFSGGLACQLWTNYGNALSHVRRSIEAIDAYDSALRINPLMGMALGNKGMAVSHLAQFMYGHTHLFYLEAIRLLTFALKQPLTHEARYGFSQRLEHLNRILHAHGEMKPEEIQGIEPKTKFHQFLCEFNAENGLFLNPATFLGKEKKTFYGDPLFISTMYADLADTNRFDRYVTFFNEIKQDYVLGRFFLAQSQYRLADIDVVDEGVSVFNPLDYSLYSTYIQLLKAANKQAVAVLDKIAYFIYDYCKLTTPAPDRVTLRQIWGGNDRLRGDLNGFANPYLFAVFTLSQDVSKKR